MEQTELIEAVVELWEKANYHVNVFDDLYNPGCKWISAWLDEYEVRIYLHDKEWSIEKVRSCQTRITVKHMGLIDETGQILGWW